MARGFVYLAAVVDWFRRRVLAWRVSITLEVAFCIDVVEEALARFGKPTMFNTDQGSQFTSADFSGLLLENAIAISMDGRGAWRDNVFVERLWRSVKYEEVYLRAYDSVVEARARSGGISTSTIPLHHTHLAMSLMRRDFAVRVLVLWGPLRVVLRGGCWPWSLACREQRDRIATDHLEVDGSR
jgi:putative transposase